MFKSFSSGFRKRSALIAAIACMLIFLVVAISYEQYLTALVWHCVNGNYTEFSSYQVSVPPMWWRMDSGRYGESRLVRAMPTFSVEPIPEVTSNIAAPSEYRATNDEESQLVQQLVSERKNSPMGAGSAFVLVHSGKFDLYCFKDSVSLGRAEVMTCYAARVKFSFGYDGPSGYQAEAESILASIH